jgi:tetratricopeptide (TPR) repeat protein
MKKSPFSPICNEMAAKFDKANRDIEKTKILIEEAKTLLRSHDDPEYAPMFYSIGTSLMIIRDAEVRKVEASDGYPYTDSCVINLNSDLIWYLRHAEELVDQIEATEDTIPYLIGLKMILYVNLGNALDFCGRKCLAIEYYSKAINIKPFGMGFGNIGICLEHYAELEGDPGHRVLIFKKAYECYCKVELLDDPYTYPKAKEKFCRNRKNMEKRFGRVALRSQSTEYKAVEFESERESDYRHWCLSNRLFLNTLNDLPEHNNSAFMTDSLHITSITTGTEQKEIPFVFEMFNQVKEEYIYSRYLLYEVVNCDYNVHYADKETHLDEVLNYSSYSIRLEKLKTAFRTAYSIFDRIAFLLNSYLNLGIEERQVNFKGIWKYLDEKEKKNIAIGALHVNFQRKVTLDFTD